MSNYHSITTILLAVACWLTAPPTTSAWQQTCLKNRCHTAGFVLAQCHVRRGHYLFSATTSATTTTTTSSVVELPKTIPLAPHTFAGMVERRLQDKFGANAVDRIIQSWRFMEQGYEHYEYVGDRCCGALQQQQQQERLLRDEEQQQQEQIKTKSGSVESNQQNSHCYQHCHSYVPGLRVQSFWNEQDLDWVQKLRNRFDDIRDEFQQVTAIDPEYLQRQGNNIWAGALTEDAASYGLGWRTLVLMDRGRWDPVNANLFPKTAVAVHESGCPAVEVFFASLKGRSDVKRHSDYTNFLLTSHLAIDVPENGHNKCRITIGDETRQWINGQVMLFDGTILHDAINESDLTRYILMIRLWHPDLTKAEQHALQYIYDCLDYPELMECVTLQDRLEVERLVDATHDFPLLSGL